MNWVIGIQRAIDYIEENLCEKIDYDEAQNALIHLFFIFSVYSVCYAVLPLAIISDKDGSLSPARSFWVLIKRL